MRRRSEHAESRSANRHRHARSASSNQGDLPQQAEVYEYTGPYTDLEGDRGDQLTKLKLEEWESCAKRFYGVGSLPGVDVGRWFALLDHPEHDRDSAEDRKCAVVETNWYIRNTLPAGESRTLLFPPAARPTPRSTRLDDRLRVSLALEVEYFHAQLQMRSGRRAAALRQY
ncbi:contractile injection system protein, VgrG/Pvc8 family [Burkholderia ubonensis]|uniref:contractile injection system protein, VgrG/Pvc8 family n=1 Tax=Burkholderia ubonensis TaxID=101571 RepID=UPI0009B368DC